MDLPCPSLSVLDIEIDKETADSEGNYASMVASRGDETRGTRLKPLSTDCLQDCEWSEEAIARLRPREGFPIEILQDIKPVLW